MKKNFKRYKSIEKWEEDGEKDNSYYVEEVAFTIKCDNCGGEATIYQEFEQTYCQQPIIKCNDCINEERLYGCDG